MFIKVGVLLWCVLVVNGEINKRKAACAAKYQNIPNHSACASPSPKMTEEGVSKSDQDYIVKEHNRIRREVKPAATNMRSMSWDQDLADTAQAWASVCSFAHDSNSARVSVGRFSVGQNIAIGTGKKSWKVAVNAWEGEKDDFKYGKAPLNGAVVGHYTQQVWADTVKIGCGYANCGSGHYYVCNYGPGGNIQPNQYKPWKTGSACSACSTKCNDKLCDCGDKVCLNGGTTDLNTCDCTCTQSFFGGPLKFFSGDTCELDCKDAKKKQPAYCGGNGFDNCKISTVQTHCPVLCGAC